MCGGEIMKKYLLGALSIWFCLLGIHGDIEATQSVFSDSSAGSCTDPAPSNTGNGTCTINSVTAFTPTETVTFTATTAGPSATFSVNGSVSGPFASIVSGSAQNVIDAYGYTHMNVTFTNGGTSYVIGDNFQVVMTAGTELKKSNFDLFTLSQVCLNGCSAGASQFRAGNTNADLGLNNWVNINHQSNTDENRVLLYNYFRNSGNTASTHLQVPGLFEYDRRITSNTTDTNIVSGLQISHDFNIGAASTLTNSSNPYYGLRLNSISFTGAGALALSQFYKIGIDADSTNTGTAKVGLFVGAQTGATNNAAISDNNAFSGSYFINSTSTNASLLSGQLQLPNGSASTPSLSFSSDTGTGFYRAASGTVSYATGSTQVASFISTGLYFPNASTSNVTGGASAQGGLTLYSNADAWTYLYNKDGSHGIRLQTGAGPTTALTVDQNQAVTMAGTTTSTGKLTVNNDTVIGTGGAVTGVAQLQINGVTNIGPVANAGGTTTVVLTGGAVYFIFVTCTTTGNTALFTIGRSSTVSDLLVQDATVLFSSTSGTASKVNITNSSGTLTIQNNSTTNNANFKIYAIRMA